MATTPSRSSGPAAINDFNAWLKQQPWYQQFFQQIGQDMSRVNLSRSQQSQLEQLMARNGVPLGDGVHVDNAGNLNEKNRLGRNVAIGAGIAAGGYLAAPAIAGVLGGSSIPTIGGTALNVGSGTGIAAGTSAAAGGGGAFTTLANALKNPMTRTLLSGAGRMVSGAGDAAAANRGTQIETQLAHDQLKLAAEREGRARQSDAYRKAMLGQLATSYQPSTRPAGSEGRFAQGFITPEAREAGQRLYSQGMEQMKRGDAPSITPFDQLATQPGRFERFSQYAAPGLSMFDLLAEARKR